MDCDGRFSQTASRSNAPDSPNRPIFCVAWENDPIPHEPAFSGHASACPDDVTLFASLNEVLTACLNFHLGILIGPLSVGAAMASMIFAIGDASGEGTGD